MATKAELQSRVDLLEKDNAELRRMLARAERELNDKLLPEEMPPQEITYLIRCWMKHYGMPWEAFWCYVHHCWCDELDTSFPYSIENTCPQCRA